MLAAMLYCQQCGAGNAKDARFCNQCGGKIASAGEPGGPIATDATRPDTLAGFDDAKVPRETRSAPAVEEPHAEGELEDAPVPRASRPSRASTSSTSGASSFDVSQVSLSTIGVRSRGKAWGVILLVVLALVGVGAGGTWLAMQQSGSEPVASAEELEGAGGTEDIEIGDLLPEGEEPPDVVTGTPRPAEGGGTTRPATGGARPTKNTGGSGGSSTGGSSTGGSSTGGSSTGGASTGGSSTGGSSTGGSSTGGSSTGGSSTGGSSTGGSSTGGSSTGGSSTGGSSRPEPDWDSLEEEVGEEPDYEMDDYSTRVRNVVRTYYARRAQNCFELATRNHESVRGTVVIGFRIGADGAISRAEVVRNTTKIETLGACLRAQVDSWQLPPPPEGRAPLPMQMPFSR